MIRVITLNYAKNIIIVQESIKIGFCHAVRKKKLLTDPETRHSTMQKNFALQYFKYYQNMVKTKALEELEAKLKECAHYCIKASERDKNKIRDKANKRGN